MKGGGRVTVHLCGWRYAKKCCRSSSLTSLSSYRVVSCRIVVSSMSSSSSKEEEVEDGEERGEGGGGRSPADIRRKRRKTTVIGDNRFRPAWNEKERKMVGGGKKRRRWDEKKRRELRVLKWNHRWWTAPTMLLRGRSSKTRNSNASRNCRWCRYSSLFSRNSN